MGAILTIKLDSFQPNEIDFCEVPVNFVFISPHFPTHYWRFCAALKELGVRVLGVADTSFDSLHPNLQASLTDFYQVHSLEDGDAVLRAVAWFTHKYGKIDWLESHNEHWLAQDAWLRSMFNIQTGPNLTKIASYKKKSSMKDFYHTAGIKAAPYILAGSQQDALDFAGQVGYPLVAKPDTGVGANDTYLIEDQAQLQAFFSRLPLQPYLIEPFIDGQVCSYDALIGQQGQPLYETGNITLVSVMEVVNKKIDSVYMIVPELAPDVVQAGRRTSQAFGVRGRLIHLEFFRLNRDHPGLGRKGELLGLEVNMRPSGGFTPDMINYAGSVDIHRLYAQMVVRDAIELDASRRTFHCVFVGRQDVHAYALSHLDLLEKWRHRVVFHDRMPLALSGAMGNQIYLAQCLDRQEADSFIEDATRRLEYAQDI